MRTKLIFSIVFGLFYIGLVGAQSVDRQVIGSTGGSGQSAINQMDYTIGEVVIETFVTNNATFTQGFHQSNLTKVGIRNIIENDVFSVYPNPANSSINVQFEGEQKEAYLIKIVSLTGVTVKEIKTFSSNLITTIDVSNLSAASYLLLIINIKTGNQSYVIFEKIN